MIENKEEQFFGIIELNDESIDTSYTQEDIDNFPVIKMPFPDPRNYPECFDWECKLKDGIHKEIGDPIYYDEYEYMLPTLKENWKEIIRGRK